MSKENVEAFKRGLEAGNRGDVDALLDELHPEIEWHSALHALMGGQQTVFRGHDGVRRMIADLYETFAVVHIEMSEFRDLGDGLVAIGRTRTRGKASGVETVTPLALVTEIRNGKTISRLPRSQGGPRSRAAAGIARTSAWTSERYTLRNSREAEATLRSPGRRQRPLASRALSTHRLIPPAGSGCVWLAANARPQRAQTGTTRRRRRSARRSRAGPARRPA